MVQVALEELDERPDVRLRIDRRIGKAGGVAFPNHALEAQFKNALLRQLRPGGEPIALPELELGPFRIAPGQGVEGEIEGLHRHARGLA